MMSVYRSITSDMPFPVSPASLNNARSSALPRESSHSSRPSPTLRSTSPQRKRKKKNAVDVDELLVEKLTSHQDEASSFGEHVAARLRGFTARQRAMACLEIDRVLLNIEFPPEVHVPHPQNTSYIPPSLFPIQNPSHDTPRSHSHGNCNTDQYPY